MESSEKVDDVVVVANVLSKPWKNSDIILVAGTVEFHVHRAILCLHSPVFEAMLNGDFREAKQDKISLQGKDPSEMEVFLKLLYHSKFFDNPLNEGNVAKVLALADEYQAEAITKQCFAETVITADNALDILPYASKYDQSVYQKCIKVAQSEIKWKNLKKSMPKLEPNVREEILGGKCELLEDALMRARDNLIACMNKLSHLCEVVKTKGIRIETTTEAAAVCFFFHEVKIDGLHKTKQCKACLSAYRAKFCDCVPMVQSQRQRQRYQFRELTRSNPNVLLPPAKPENHQLFQLLQDIDELLSQKSD